MKRIFAALFVTTFVAWLGYEVWAIATPAAGDTISEIVWALSSRRPFVPFGVGFGLGLLCGHFFWQRVD